MHKRSSTVHVQTEFRHFSISGVCDLKTASRTTLPTEEILPKFEVVDITRDI